MGGPSFNRAWEHAEYLRETTEFIESELRYAGRMIQVFEAEQSHRDRSFARAARRYLTGLRSSFDIAQRSPSLRLTFFEVFPDVMRNLTTALFQRRETAFPRPSPHSAARGSFAPSEVTVEYPLTIRAAESVNEDYHQRIRPFYQVLFRDASCEPPLVNLFGSTAASLLIQSRLISAVVLEHDSLAKVDLRSVAVRLVDLSCISLPRWSSQHVRTYAWAAHEHMHRLLWVVALSRDFVNARFEKRHKVAPDELWARPDDPTRRNKIKRYWQVADTFAPTLGEDLIQLLKFTQELYQEIRGFMASYGDGGVPTALGIPEEVLQNHRATIAWDFANELLCDTGATIMAGPAFLFAYTTVYAPNSEEDDLAMRDARHETQPGHPATVIRILLQAKVLEVLGFDTVAASIRTVFRKDIAALKRYPLLAQFSSFLLDTTWDVFARVMQLLARVALTELPQGCYDLKRVGEAEAAVLERWTFLAHQVEDIADIMPGDLRDVRPADLINAIWWKRCAHPGAKPVNRLAWRGALKNCLTGAASDETRKNVRDHSSQM